VVVNYEFSALDGEKLVEGTTPKEKNVFFGV